MRRSPGPGTFFARLKTFKFQRRSKPRRPPRLGEVTQFQLVPSDRLGVQPECQQNFQMCKPYLPSIWPLIHEGRESTMASHFHILGQETHSGYCTTARIQSLSFFAFQVPAVLYVAQGAIEDVNTLDFLRLNQSTVGIDQDL